MNDCSSRSSVYRVKPLFRSARVASSLEGKLISSKTPLTVQLDQQRGTDIRVAKQARQVLHTRNDVRCHAPANTRWK